MTTTGEWSTRIVDRLTHKPLAEHATGGRDPYEGMVVTEATDELNQPGEMNFMFPTLDKKMRQFRGGGWMGKEIQLWRDDKCEWWGPIGNMTMNQGVVSAKAYGSLWHFSGLNFGPIINNYLVNPNFNGSLAGWTASGVTANFDASQDARTDLGGVAGSARLDQAFAGTDTYLGQVFHAPPTSSVEGVFYTLAGWFKIDPATTYQGPAYLERGLFIGRLDSMGNPVLSNWARINNRLVALGTWARLAVGITIPPSSDNFLDCRAYAPGCRLWWDALSLTIQESVAPSLPGQTTDVTNILAAIVAFSQSAAQQKADLGITFAQVGGAPNPMTGTVLDRTYQYFNLEAVMAAIQEFPGRSICDIAVLWDKTNPGAGKFFQVFPGQRGTSKPTLAIELAYDPTCHVRPRLSLNYGETADIDRSANDVVWLGRGSAGSDREFGRARDTSALGGLVRQKIQSAPSDADIDLLDGYAHADLSVLKTQASVPQITVPGHLSSQIDVGDTIPVRVDYGFLYANANQRVVRRRLRPPTDDLVLEMNLI